MATGVAQPFGKPAEHRPRDLPVSQCHRASSRPNQPREDCWGLVIQDPNLGRGESVVAGARRDASAADEVIHNAQREPLASPPLSGSVTALSRVVGSPIGQKCRILRNLNQVSLYPLRDHTDNEPIASTVGIFHKRPERHRDVTGGLRVLFVGRGPSGRGGDELKDSVVLHASTVPARSTRSVLRNEQLARQRRRFNLGTDTSDGEARTCGPAPTWQE